MRWKPLPEFGSAALVIAIATVAIVEASLELQTMYDAPHYKGSETLLDMVAPITGGDSGIGRSVAVLFAREGADVAVAYLDEHDDAAETKRAV